MSDKTSEPDRVGPSCSRRQILLAGGAGAVTVLLGDLFPGRVGAQDTETSVRFAGYPRKRVGRLSELIANQPVRFAYPDETGHSMSLLVKLDRPAGGGVGPDLDVVAFNAMCTHQGGPLVNSYNAEYAVAGPCPLHLTTFDLTRHGMASGQATENLPQVVLETEGDEIFAIGVLGLIYGYPSNLAFVTEDRA